MLAAYHPTVAWKSEDTGACVLGAGGPCSQRLRSHHLSSRTQTLVWEENKPMKHTRSDLELGEFACNVSGHGETPPRLDGC